MMGVLQNAFANTSSGFIQSKITGSHLNPFFFMIDGFRHGFFGSGDVSPWTSLAIVGGTCAVVAYTALRLLASGFKLRH